MSWLETALGARVATFVKIVGDRPGWVDQKLYRLRPPLDGADYVVVSASAVGLGMEETYIFAADEHGEITEWNELSGSYRGGLDHEQALRNAHYNIIR